LVHKTQRKPKGKEQSGMDNPETLAEFGTQDTEKTEGGRANQEWTTQIHWQNLVKTDGKPKGKGQSGMDNTETLAEFSPQDTEKTEGEGTIRNGQHRYTGRMWYTRHRENRSGRDNQE
jgi:hypothetical protein